MPPPNLDATTAIEIDFPYDITTDPESNANELWYKFTATSAMEPAVGFHVWSPTAYHPWVIARLGPAGAPTDYLGGFYADRKAIVVPVTAGTEYFIAVTGATGSSYSAGNTFRLRGYVSPDEPTPVGSILIPDDTSGFPASILDRSTGETLKLVDFPAGEAGAVLSSGHFLTEDQDNPSDLQLYDGQFAHVATLTGLAAGTWAVSAVSDRFYVSTGATLRTVDTDGNIGATTWTLAVTAGVLAVDDDASIAYYRGSGSGAAVRRFDLTNDVALSDLAAGITNYFIGSLHIATDGTIVVHYHKTSGGVDHFIRRYNTDGSTAQTYAFGTSAINDITFSDEANHIWLWQQSSGQGTFKEMNLADGTFRTSWTTYDSIAGVSEEPATADPTVTFGHSFSCPFFVIQTGPAPQQPLVDDSDPCCVDFSTLLSDAFGCGSGPTIGTGSSGPLQPPAAGTWTNSLNATPGAGGGSGASWSVADPTIDEAWD